MDLHWTYKSNSTKTPEGSAPSDTGVGVDSLEQGDILRSDYEPLHDLLKKYHPYYAEHPDNEFFIVLTQSCDLVFRDGGYKAPYISIAPVRPLRKVIQREFDGSLHNKKPDAQAYGSGGLRGQFEFFLERLFNNNHPKYFYLEKQPDRGLPEDMCSILTLGISIKTEHYESCLNARVLQLADNFQAKLGWLVGQLYSRVGTPDWPEGQLENKISEKLKDTAAWVNDELIAILDKKVADFEANNENKHVDATTLKKLMDEIPNKKEQAIDAIFTVLVSEKLLPAEKDPQKFNLRKKLRSDAAFSLFFKSK